MTTNRKIGLGVDTGGTYTDAAIVDLNSLEVLASAKSQTTHHDLAIGLLQSVDDVLGSSGMDPSDISMVGISTTLATNSILEGRGGDVGLILIGWSPIGDVDFGEDVQAVIKGRVDHNGRISESVDAKELDEAIAAVTKDTDAVAVSGIFSVFNSSLENQVRRRVREIAGLPVIVGTDLTTELGIDLRTETAVLNARLIPVLNRFFDDVSHTFSERGLKSPIMIYKGDGSLMNLETARLRPVETILSGPAASAMGGCILAGLKDCIIVDIGGTSTDIGFLDGGFPRIQKEGATVGRWRTRVRAVDMWTAALGGDSHIWLRNREPQIGPERVVPLCMTSIEHPSLRQRLSEGRLEHLIAYPSRGTGLTGNLRKVYDFILDNDLVDERDIRDGLKGIWLVTEYLERLKRIGAVVGVGLTPTDLLHSSGECFLGDAEASELGLQLLADRMFRSRDDTLDMLRNELEIRIASEVARKLLMDEFEVIPGGGWDEELVRKAVTPSDGSSIRLSTHLDRPLVCVGAPAQFLMPPLSARLGADVIIPQDSIVGNAVGAVCSKITDVVTVTVQPGYHSNYMVRPPLIGLQEHQHLSSAINAASTNAARYVHRRVEEAGGTDVEVIVTRSELRANEGEGSDADQLNFVEVTARAVGVPDLDRLSRGQVSETKDREQLLGVEAWRR